MSHPLILQVTKTTDLGEKVYHVRGTSSSPSSPEVVTPTRSRSPENVPNNTNASNLPVSQPNSPTNFDKSTKLSDASQADKDNFTVNFYLKGISKDTNAVEDCVVKEKDVNLLMNIKNIIVTSSELSSATAASAPAAPPAPSKKQASSSSASPKADKDKKNKKKRVSTRLFNEPEFEELLHTWEVNSLPLGAWSMGMHSLLKEKFPLLLKKYNYFDTDKKVHLCQYLFEKSNKRKAEMGIVRQVKRIKPSANPATPSGQ